MYTMRTGDEEDPSMLDPIFRKITFSDAGAVMLVTKLLRRAWMQKGPPGEDVNKKSFRDYVKKLHDTPTEEDELNKISDTEDLGTSLRREIIEFWGNVHWDTVQFLDEATPYCGSFGERTSLRLGFSEEGEGAVVKDHDFGANVLVIPAYVAQGLKIRVTRSRADGTEAELGVFDVEKDPYEIYYLRRGFKFNFYVDEERPAGAEGQKTAAVLSVNVLKFDEPTGELAC